MFGCAHNRGRNSFTPEEGYEYGNLLKANDPNQGNKEFGYVSVMAYKDTAAGYTIRSFKLSSPELFIWGVPTGEADKTDCRYGIIRWNGKPDLSSMTNHDIMS